MTQISNFESHLIALYNLQQQTQTYLKFIHLFSVCAVFFHSLVHKHIHFVFVWLILAVVWNAMSEFVRNSLLNLLFASKMNSVILMMGIMVINVYEMLSTFLCAYFILLYIWNTAPKTMAAEEIKVKHALVAWMCSMLSAIVWIYLRWAWAIAVERFRVVCMTNLTLDTIPLNKFTFTALCIFSAQLYSVNRWEQNLSEYVYLYTC